MAMEVLGGNLPAGRPVAVFAGGRTHVFAIGYGGMMNHWTSTNGIDWQGPGVLPRLTTDLVPSYPCAIALGDAIHVFAINNGGALVRWSSVDGAGFTPAIVEGWTIPGGTSGIAVCSPNPNRIDAFAVTSTGLVCYSWEATLTSLGSRPLPPNLPLGNLPPCVPAAVSSAPNTTDLFAVSQDGRVLRWRSPDGLTWVPSVVQRPSGVPAGPFVRSGFAAVSTAPGKIDLFAVTTGAQVAHWSMDGENVTTADFLPPPPNPIIDGVPVAIVVDGRVEVFVIGNPLVRWRRRDGGEWTGAKLIDASLSAGGLSAAVTSDGRIDVFGLGSGGLQHWPAGIDTASNERWTNWANNLQFNPVRHCRPSTEEEVVAIVKTAERAGLRVRAVGSSWSFTDITLPTAPGVIVETNQIDGLITHVIDQSVLTENAPDAKYLVHAEAGIQVEQLMTILDALGLAPFTMGGSSGQTLAGVISTSVHGSHWDRGPIPNAVRAIQLVGPGGTRYWIEPDRWRITKEVELRQRLGPGVQIRYDDDWFDSVLVSMGSMGIITAVVLEVTEQYFLTRTCTEWTWSALRPKLEDGSLFADPEHYVMIAFDPRGIGTDRPCFVTTCQRSNGPASGPSGSSDPLGVFCGAKPARCGDLLEGVAGAAAVIGIRAAGPGLLGDLLATLFNTIPNGSEHLAAFASQMTRDALKPGTEPSVDLAHKILAPVDTGECAARGLALELGFDATTGGYLGFLDTVLSLLDERRAGGLVLGGWFSLRFVGPSRAILSPQQSARTCMIEVVSVRGLKGTVPLLNELEELGRSYGAIQHWGMHNNAILDAAALPRAYPRLDTWRRVRREISGDGAIRTFENDFTARLGLDAPPSATPLVWQQDWKWCSKCLGMAYAGGAPGRCPAGGTHEHNFSGNYGFAHNAPWVPGQRRWRWCSKCMGMTLENEFASPCPAGGAHDLGSSGEYTILRNGEADWKWCDKCQGLAFARGAPGPCPAGGTHNHPNGGSGYWLAFAPLVAAPAPADAPAPAPTGTIALPPATELTFGPGAAPALGPASGPAFELHPVFIPPLLAPRPELPHSSPEFPGERGWRRCSRCKGVTKAGGRCVGGEPHLHDEPRSYVIPLNAPTAPGQAHWRLCKKCQTLVFRDGVCFAGGVHDFTGSGDYTLRSAGQNEWRHCKSCNGLWFSGNGGLGKCASPAGVHDLGTDDYVMVPRS